MSYLSQTIHFDCCRSNSFVIPVNTILFVLSIVIDASNLITFSLQLSDSFNSCFGVRTLSLIRFHYYLPGSNQHSSINGDTSVTTGSLLDDYHWHSVIIERYGRNVNFTLDRDTQHFRTNGEFDHLDLDYEVRNQRYLKTKIACKSVFQR